MNVPQRLGRYRIVERIGRGGMGEVLLAIIDGPSGFSRPIAIKRIRKNLVHQPRFVDALRDEARLCAQLAHANIVQVYELCEDDGEVFVTMEHLSGVSSREVMSRPSARAQMTPALAAYIVAEACAGLHAAHTLTAADGTPLGIVHRDVSLDNIFVTFDGDIKVLDFGVASAAQRMTYTLPGEIKGKLTYMAPEQLRGEPVTPQTDVFAAGIVLYELTTARRLFQRADEDATMKAVLVDEIPGPGDIEPDCPAALDRVCRDALQRDPTLRLPDALRMRRAILSAIADVRGATEPKDDLRALMLRSFSDEIDRQRHRIARASIRPSADQAKRAEEDLRTLPFMQAAAPPIDQAASPRTIEERAAPLTIDDVALLPTSTRRPFLVLSIATGIAVAIVVGFVFARQRPNGAAPPPVTIAPPSTPIPRTPQREEETALPVPVLNVATPRSDPSAPQVTPPPPARATSHRRRSRHDEPAKQASDESEQFPSFDN